MLLSLRHCHNAVIRQYTIKQTLINKETLERTNNNS